MKKILAGLLVLGSMSSFAANTCKNYIEANNMNSICADIVEMDNVVHVSNPRLVDTNGIDWPIGKGISPKTRAQKICESLGIKTDLVVGYSIAHLGQGQANVNLKGKTFTSMFDAIVDISCLKY